MFARLLILFTVLPLLELFVLLKVGAAIGLLNTVLLVVVTAVTGACLARREGLQTWWRIRQQLAAGALPADELIDGALILVAGILLITPGLITDLFGFSLLIPFTRTYLKKGVRRWFSDRIGRGDFQIRRRGDF